MACSRRSAPLTGSRGPGRRADAPFPSVFGPIALALVLGAACASVGPRPCTSDADCSADRVCRGVCEPRALADGGAPVDGGAVDGAADAGLGPDASVTPDAGSGDAGPPFDAGRLPDAGPRDRVEIESEGARSNDTPAGAEPVDTGAHVRGTIGPYTQTLGVDEDLYRFDAPEQGYYEVRLSRAPDSGTDLLPAIELLDSGEAVYFSNPNRGGAADIRLEAYATRAGTHYLRVSDARNRLHTSDTRGPGVAGRFGGADYGYVLSVRPLARPVTTLSGFPISAESSAAQRLDMSGKTAWFTFELPRETGQRIWLDLDLRAAGAVTADGSSLYPRMWLFGEDSSGRPRGAPIAGGAVALLRELPLWPGRYTLAVADDGGDFSAFHHGFRVRVVSAGPVRLLVDSGAHPTPRSALPLTPLPAAVAAVLADEEEHWYSLGALQAGERIRLWTDASEAGDEVDTELTVYRGDGVTEVARDDDGGRGLFSRLEGVVLPGADDYLVRVTRAFGPGGPYRLFALLGDAAEDACGAQDTGSPGTLALNEVLARPGTSADANQDGQVDHRDAFVEVVNASRQPRSIGGALLRNARGLRHRFACGSTLAPGAAHVVFGGCAPSDGGAACAGVTVTNHSPEHPELRAADTGWDHSEGGDEVMLLDARGRILDRFAFGAGESGVSWARALDERCDEPWRTTAAVQVVAHAACNAERAYSPGTRSDGTTFAPPPSLPGEDCASAAPLTPGVTRTQQTLDGYQRDYGEGTLCAGGGEERVYSALVPPGQRLHVTATPAPGFDVALSLVLGPAERCAAIPRVCLTHSDAALGGQPESLTWLNRDSAPATVFVLVERASFGIENASFELRADIGERPAGDTCTSATTLLPGVHSGQTSAGFTDDYSGFEAACGGGATPGPDRVYALTVPANTTLRATVIPESAAFDPAVYIVDARVPGACEATPKPCFAGSDSGGDGASESVTYTNTTSQPIAAWLVVDTFRQATGGGAFALDVTLTP